MFISYLLTSWKEPGTIGRAMEAIINQKNRPNEWELLIAAPDEETLNQAGRIKEKYSNFDISIFQDQGKGKPAALNLLFLKAKGDIWILTDGDVWMDECASEKLLEKLTPPNLPFVRGGRQDKMPPPLEGGGVRGGVGIVSGRPVPTNDRNTLLGFWAHILTQSADYKRRKLSAKGRYFDASGYLFAIRRECLNYRHFELGQSSGETIVGSRNENQNEIESSSKHGTTDKEILPENILVDDSYLSHLIHEIARRTPLLTNFAMAKNISNIYSPIAYSPGALVYVKFPTALSDWFKQKIRSTGGYLQIQKLFPHHSQMRTFWQEILEFFIPLKFIKSPKEFFWLILLYFARLYLWLRIFIFYKLLKRSFSSGWPRIESTK